MGSDGSVYIADSQNNRVRHINPQTGVITTVAGNGSSSGEPGDGGLGTDAVVVPVEVAVDPEGTLLISDLGRIRTLRPRMIVTPTSTKNTGTISTLAGTGEWGFWGDLGPAAAAAFRGPNGVAVAPSGNVYISDTSNQRIRRVRLFLPSLSGEAVAIASADGSERYGFDASGRHLDTRDALTNALLYQFAYDSTGLLSGVTDGDGNVTTIERDAAGKPTGIVGPFGQRTGLSVDTAGYLETASNPAGESVALTYHPGGLLATLTDPRGNLHSFTYGADGRLERDDDPAGGFTTLARTEFADGYEVTRTTALGRTTLYSVEELPEGGERRTTTLPSGLVTETVTWTDGTGTSSTPDGTVASWTLGPDPRFGMTAPLPKNVQVSTPGGLTSTLQLRRRVTLTDADDPASLATQVDTLLVNGRAHVTNFDALARTVRSETPEGRESFADLDSLGRMVRDSVTGLVATAVTYDGVGRVSQVSAGTRTWGYDYDAAGRLLSITDPTARVDSFFYDTADRLVRQVFADGREVHFAYDSSGNLKSVTPPSRPAHGFTYTPIDQTESYDPPDLGVGEESTTYGYNLDRQLTTITRPDGQVLSFAYDSTTGRLSRLVTPGGEVVPAYDSLTGNLSTLSGPYGGSLSFDYDGSLVTGVTWSGAVAGSVSAAYDNDFRVVKTYVNGADSVAFGYDNDGLLVAAGGLTVSRDSANGIVTGTTLGRVSTTPSYNVFGEWDGYVARLDSTDLYVTSYTTRDDLGRIRQLVETIQGQTKTYDYDYDAAGRLWQVKTDGVVTAVYEYDANGNRLQFTGPGGVVTGSYDAQDRMLSYGDASYTYTTNGEVQLKVVGSDTTRYVYDVLGNLMSVTLPDGTLIEYVIDPSSRRVGKKVNGVLRQGFLYGDQLNPVAELDSTGNVVSRFTYATRINVPDFMVRGGNTYRIVSDHLGSVRLVVNTADGTVAQRIDYDEFGRVTLNTNPGFQPFGYAGGLVDGQTDLVRFGARDYDATTGRWTTKDPIGFGGGSANLYTYVGNDPLSSIDPTGEIWWAIGGAAAMGAYESALLQLLLNGCIDWGWVLFDGLLAGATAGAFIGGIFGVRYLRAATGPVKAWVRVGSTYSRANRIPTFGVRWGSNPHYAQQIGNSTLRALNQQLHNMRIPFGNWRFADPGHFHFFRRFW